MNWFTVVKATDAWLVTNVEYDLSQTANPNRPKKQSWYLHRNQLRQFIHGDEQGERRAIKAYIEEETGYPVISFTHKFAGLGGFGDSLDS